MTSAECIRQLLDLSNVPLTAISDYTLHDFKSLNRNVPVHSGARLLCLTIEGRMSPVVHASLDIIRDGVAECHLSFRYRIATPKQPEQSVVLFVDQTSLLPNYEYANQHVFDADRLHVEYTAPNWRCQIFVLFGPKSIQVLPWKPQWDTTARAIHIGHNIPKSAGHCDYDLNIPLKSRGVESVELCVVDCAHCCVSLECINQLKPFDVPLESLSKDIDKEALKAKQAQNPMSMLVLATHLRRSELHLNATLKRLLRYCANLLFCEHSSGVDLVLEATEEDAVSGAAWVNFNALLSKDPLRHVPWIKRCHASHLEKLLQEANRFVAEKITGTNEQAQDVYAVGLMGSVEDEHKSEASLIAQTVDDLMSTFAIAGSTATITHELMRLDSCAQALKDQFPVVDDNGVRLSVMEAAGPHEYRARVLFYNSARHTVHSVHGSQADQIVGFIRQVGIPNTNSFYNARVVLGSNTTQERIKYNLNVKDLTQDVYKSAWLVCDALMELSRDNGYSVQHSKLLCRNIKAFFPDIITLDIAPTCRFALICL